MAEVAPVTFGDNLPGFEIGSKADPAIIVIQEWWGVTPVVKKQAALLSSKGYRVLIPDLYKGKIGVDAEEAHHLMENLDFKHAVTEIEQAAKYLKESGAPKIGITGFCMGGALTFASASLIKDLQVAVPCYGTPPHIFDVTQIKIPVLGIFGSADKHKGFADEETARAVESKIKAAGGDIEIKVYEGAPHGFLNQIVGPEGLEMVQKFHGAVAPQTSVEAAWNDLSAFFDKHLKA